jgi:hypothetical protein
MSWVFWPKAGEESESPFPALPDGCALGKAPLFADAEAVSQGRCGQAHGAEKVGQDRQRKWHWIPVSFMVFGRQRTR